MFTTKRRRDEEFSLFAASATPSLTGTAWLLTSDRDAASELVQAALVKTYVAWPRVRAGEALAYTRRALINHHIDTWRKDARLVHDDTPELKPDPRSPEGDVDTRDAVVRMLATLPPQQRTIIVLTYLEDMSEADVAAHLKITPGAVKSAKSRGLTTLRTSYAPAEGNPS